MGFSTLNMITTIGSFIFAIGVLLFFVNVWKSRRSGAPAGDNPWDGPTLEWSIPSPPPAYNFAVIPTVASRNPLWEDRLGEGRARSTLDEGLILDCGKETLATTPLDAEPDLILRMPEDSLAPVSLALGLLILFTGLLLRLWPMAVVGGLVCAAALIAWMWPRAELKEREAGNG
jgi:cytochrome c oxidase subunit I+III